MHHPQEATSHQELAEAGSWPVCGDAAPHARRDRRSHRETGVRRAHVCAGPRAQKATYNDNVDIDKRASSITFVGANWWRYRRRVVDPTVFDQGSRFRWSKPSEDEGGRGRSRMPQHDPEMTMVKSPGQVQVFDTGGCGFPDSDPTLLGCWRINKTAPCFSTRGSAPFEAAESSIGLPHAESPAALQLGIRRM
jgi:hypothetical protein